MGSSEKVMAQTFEELLDLSDFDGTSQIAKFIHKEDEGINTYRSTWSYVSYSYARAFDELARKAFDDGARGANLGNALFFLARHSIELELKNIIVEFSATDDAPPELAGHNLVKLWEQLSGYMERWGVPATDDWGVNVAILIADLQEADPGGDRFRYPADIKGKPFEPTRVEVEGLIRAHNSITTYLDACGEMHSDGYRG
jgi:hypothetical protein